MKKSRDGSTRNHQGLKSRNLISFPLDIPDVDVIRVEKNEHGDYIVMVESMLKAPSANPVVVGLQSPTVASEKLNYDICPF